MSIEYQGVNKNVRIQKIAPPPAIISLTVGFLSMSCFLFGRFGSRGAECRAPGVQ